MATLLRTLLVLALTAADGVRPNVNAGAVSKVSNTAEGPSSHTPIGLVLKMETLASFMPIIAPLGEGGQAKVMEGFIGDAAQIRALKINNLRSLTAMADELIAANEDAYSRIKGRCLDLLEFIDQHHDQFGVWSFNAEKSHVQVVHEYLQELLSDAQRELDAVQSTAEESFAEAMDSIKAESNPYAPNFQALKGRHVAVKMSTADDDDKAMLVKEVVFGTVLQSVAGVDWKVGGYLGFVCVDMGDPATNKSQKKTEKLCFSRLCPHGTMALIISEKFPGETLESGVKFEDATESTSFVNAIGSAVSSMHDHGVTHGDLRERNVMFSKPNIFIIDLGYAKFCGPEAVEAATSKFASQGLFQGVIDSAQCHYDGSQRTRSMIAHTHQFDFASDSQQLNQWLPDMVHSHLEKNAVISNIPKDACEG